MPADLVLSAAGYGVRHERGFAIDRPRGLGEWLFLHFTAPVVVRDARGERVHPAGSRLLHSPSFPQWYRGHQRGLANDWCHFAGGDAAALVARYAVPVDRVLPPVADATPAALLLALARERSRREAQAAPAAACLLELLLIAHARHGAQLGAAPPAAALAERFRALRQRVHDRLDRPWSVAEMAAGVGLRPSRFAALYRELFAASPVADLIAARVQQARWLLQSTALPVGEIARRCGFADHRHLARCFRCQVGVAPLAWRRRAEGGAGTG